MRQGQFEVIDSFAIRSKNKFCLMGRLIEGQVKENWFVNIPLNGSLSMTFRISGVEKAITVSERKEHQVLIISGDEETLDLLMGLNIEMEYLDITIEGKD